MGGGGELHSQNLMCTLVGLPKLDNHKFDLCKSRLQKANTLK